MGKRGQAGGPESRHRTNERVTGAQSLEARQEEARGGVTSAYPNEARGGVTSACPKEASGGVTSACPNEARGGVKSACPNEARGGVTSASKRKRTAGGGKSFSDPTHGSARMPLREVAASTLVIAARRLNVPWGARADPLVRFLAQTLALILCCAGASPRRLPAPAAAKIATVGSLARSLGSLARHSCRHRSRVRLVLDARQAV